MRFFFLFLGFGFGREGWVVWKRKVLGLEEKPFAVQEKEGRRKRKRKEKKRRNLSFNVVWTDVKILSRESKVLYLSLVYFRLFNFCSQ